LLEEYVIRIGFNTVCSVSVYQSMRV